jgi:hypothetical protein
MRSTMPLIDDSPPIRPLMSCASKALQMVRRACDSSRVKPCKSAITAELGVNGHVWGNITSIKRLWTTCLYGSFHLTSEYS